MADEWTTCEACGLEYMGAHRCRARKNVDPMKVVARVLYEHEVDHDELYFERPHLQALDGVDSLTADECDELAAAFGAIARRLREGGR